MDKGLSREEMKNNAHFVVLMMTNVVFAIFLTFFLAIFIRNSAKQQVNNSLNERRNDCSNVAQQFESYLYTMDMIGSNYATYIQNEKLSMSDAMAYLSHWMYFYAEGAIVDVKTLDAYRLFPGVEQPVIGNYKNNLWAEELCKNYTRICEDTESISVTDVFLDEKTKEPMIAFYEPLEIEGRKKLLLFIMKVESIRQGNVNVYGLNPQRGIVINKDGYIVLGNISEMSETENINYYDFLVSQFGQEKYQELYQEISQEESGMFDLHIGKDANWTAMFHTIHNSDGWKYIYHENVDELRRANNSVRDAVITFLFMGMWLFFDIVVYYVFYLKIQKNLYTIKDQNESLQMANRAKTSFVSNISHEIRTPINAVLGLDEMIIRDCTDETIKSYAYDIQSAGRILLSLINDVLDFSKIESGKLEIVPVEYELSTMVHEMCSMVELKAKAKFLILDVEIDPEIPDKLLGDEMHVRQVILNLLTNAVKYTEKGTVTFSIAYEKRSDTQIALKVAVKDTGIGIHPEDIDKLFSEYDRLDSVRNHKVEGTGLGLPIVSRVLEKMGSKIEVESVYGLGSVFSFTLIQDVVSWERIGDFGRRRRKIEIDNTETERSNGFKAPNIRILVVDDTPVNLIVARGLLKNTEMKIDTASDGVECLEMTDRMPYDIILLDHRMPKMDGMEVIHRLRENEGYNQKTPVIALTANAVSGAKEMYVKEGFDDFLSKPISAASLEKMIMKYLPVEYVNIVETFVDKRAGIMACGGEEIYRDVCSVFLSQSEDTLHSIQECQIHRNQKDFITLVHGMKSSARLIGAQELMELARDLEECGKIEDWATIDAKLEKLGTLTNSVTELLKKQML